MAAFVAVPVCSHISIENFKGAAAGGQGVGGYGAPSHGGGNATRWCDKTETFKQIMFSTHIWSL